MIGEAQRDAGNLPLTDTLHDATDPTFQLIKDQSIFRDNSSALAGSTQRNSTIESQPVISPALARVRQKVQQPDWFTSLKSIGTDGTGTAEKVKETTTHQSQKEGAKAFSMAAELQSLHLYDSKLLGNSAAQRVKKLSVRLTDPIKSKILAAQEKKRLKDRDAGKELKAAHLRTRLSSTHHTRSRTLGPLRRSTQSIDLKLEHNGPEPSSSACSEHNLILVGPDTEIETLKGRKANNLSPITRNLNLSARKTLQGIGQIEEKYRLEKFIQQELQLKMMQKMYGGGANSGLSARQIFEKDKQTFKLLNNDVKTLVATDKEIYHQVKPNGVNFMVIDCMPDSKPVYCVLDCGPVKLPCVFEFVLCNNPTLQVLVSSKHKFPAKSKTIDDYEREKTFQLRQPKVGFADQAAEKSMSMTDGFARDMRDRQFLHFNKHCQSEKEFNKIYLCLMTPAGGAIKLKHSFVQKRQDEEPEINEEDMKDMIKVVDGLDKWYSKEIVNLPSYANMMANNLDFERLNKTERLMEQTSEQRELALQQRMLKEYVKREDAYQRHKELESANYHKNLANLSKWDDYRNQKIDLTAIFIRVLKKKNYLRRWLRMQKAGQIYAKVVENLRARREFNRVKYLRYFTAIRFKTAITMYHRKRYGYDMDERKRHEARRCLNFAAATRYQAIEEPQSQFLTKFIGDTFLAFETSTCFTRFIRNLICVQNIRRKIQDNRDYWYAWVYKNLKEQSEYVAKYHKKAKKSKIDKKA